MIDSIKNTLLAVLYPRECAVCRESVEDASDGVACGRCWEKTCLFSGEEVLCEKCGTFLSAAGGDYAVSCRECGEHHFDTAAAVGIYEYALAASVLGLKRIPHLSKRLSGLLCNAIDRTNFGMADLILPVPLSRKRLYERRFNQAEIIAAHLSRHMGIAVDSGTLVRKRHTQTHRVGMDGRAREITVQSAFEILRPKLIGGKTILLVDDVLTSGATVSQCAKVLKRNGADKVYALTLARAIMRK